MAEPMKAFGCNDRWAEIRIKAFNLKRSSVQIGTFRCIQFGCKGKVQAKIIDEPWTFGNFTASIEPFGYNGCWRFCCSLQAFNLLANNSLKINRLRRIVPKEIPSGIMLPRNFIRNRSLASSVSNRIESVGKILKS